MLPIIECVKYHVGRPLSNGQDKNMHKIQDLKYLLTDS